MARAFMAVIMQIANRMKILSIERTNERTNERTIERQWMDRSADRPTVGGKRPSVAPVLAH